jgi:hypothetical protein
MLDIFKKRRRRFVITGLAGILTLTGVLTGCSDRGEHFAGANGKVNDGREANVSEGLVTELGDAIKDKAKDAGTVLENAKDGIREGIDDVRNNDTTSRVNNTAQANTAARTNNNAVNGTGINGTGINGTNVNRTSTSTAPHTNTTVR